MRLRGLLILLAVFLNLAAANGVWASAKEKVLYRFQGAKDGSNPSSSLVRDASGNLYGTTMQAGEGFSNCNYGCGTVFEVMPLANGHWQTKIIYAFQGGTDGANPSGNLVLDAAGNLYSTTIWGGTPNRCADYNTQGCGTVFELSPNADGSWTEAVLYRFQGNPDGAQPAGLMVDAAGNLYGTSTGNGYTQGASVYKLSPPQQKGGAWTETILTTFDGVFEVPNPGLALDSHGNLFGTTQVPPWGACSSTCGGVFELGHVGGNWVETWLYTFSGGGNGSDPMTGVILDGEGNLYGTTHRGGNNFGVVFELKRTGQQWSLTLLYNFCSANNCADGAHPLAGLVFDKAGNLNGTTYDGGTGCYKGYKGCGLVFKLAPTKSRWRETVIHRFTDNPDGSKPAASLIFDGDGNIYGTTVSGGDAGVGTVFEITP
jgi:uncharacterized repeat protein (TIGR03803 family)